MTEPRPQLEIKQALLAALAVAITLVAAEWLDLAQPGLAVWSTHMVMVQYTYSTFQKGVERIVGRSVGILLALVLATLTREAWLLGLLLEMLATVALFYLYFGGRLSYTWLNAGLYLAVVMEISRSEPASATLIAAELFYAIVLGVTVAVVVSWLAGAEQDVTIHTDGKPLWPLDRDLLSHSIMLTLTVLIVQLLCFALSFSSTTSIVAVMMLTITPDYQSLLWKGELRLAGAGLAMVFATIFLILLLERPSFPLLVLGIFLGTFLAVTLARNHERWSYAGVQMGLVLPMILVMPHSELGSLHVAFARVGGAIFAIGASVIVGVIWSAFVPVSPMPFTPVPPPKQANQPT
ncbi:MAG: FUSC family protein [Pirellulales bacterium]|nr:FUSC family protein [Pirellulales bacterium]